MVIKRFFVFLFCAGWIPGFSQDVTKTTSQEGPTDISLVEFLNDHESSNKIRFYFLPEWLEPFTLKQPFKDVPLDKLLDDVLSGTDISYLRMYPNSFVFVKDPELALMRREALMKARRQGKEVVDMILGDPGSADYAAKVTVTGTVSDQVTHEFLPFINVQTSNAHHGATTDANGVFRLQLTPGEYVLTFSSLDFDNTVVHVEVYADGNIDVEMEKRSVMLEEVVIRDRSLKELSTKRIGQIELSLYDLKKAPALMGEPDLIRQVQQLPGVTTVGEAAAGFNVRGGSIDQNLVLLDGLPIFNSSHVFGFFTAVNPDAVGNVSFFSGGIPAEFGGRASSVLDIDSRDGSFTRWTASGGIGLITGDLQIEGPVKKDKTSVMATVRSTYSDWLVRSVRTNYADLRESSVDFFDGTLKVSHRLSDETQVALTSYGSRDAFSLVGDSTYRWSNLLFSARADHRFSPTLTSDLSIGTSAYGYNVTNNEQQTASELSFSIVSTQVKAGFDKSYQQHQLRFGSQWTLYSFNPGKLRPDNNTSNTRPVSMDRQSALEQGLFFSDQWTPHPRLSIEAGFRIPLFSAFGPAEINTYRTGEPREPGTVADILKVSRGETIKTYMGLEPRLSVRYMTDPTASVKLGFNTIYQYLHLVTNSTAVSPVDIWQPSGYYLKPQRADQISLGYFKDIKKYGFSAEGFYKNLQQVTDFRDGAELVLNEHLERDLLQGRGWAYGVETSFNKNEGGLTWALNYTFSRAFRKIGGQAASEAINNGEKYPANFDQPHVINLNWKLNFSRRYALTGNFTYHSGRPVTIPLSAFRLENTTVAYFSKRNQFRIPDYHRLDLAFVMEGNHKRDKRFEGTWIFSVYNVYGRRNPYSIFFRTEQDAVLRPYQLSIIGTVFPSFSYNLKFK